jgi:hypothetical protein
MGTVGCHETSVTYCQCTVRNNPEERRSRVVMILETQREPNQNLAASGQDSEFLLTEDDRSRWVVCVCVCIGHVPTLSVRSHIHHRRIILNSDETARNFEYYHICAKRLRKAWYTLLKSLQAEI